MHIKTTHSAILILIVVACAIPFLGQPFHMDDNFYMDVARNAQINPLFPYEMPYMFQGIFWPDLASHSHPPLQTYFLAAVMHFFGESPGREWIYHLCALIFPVLAVFSFYFVCARFVGKPLWPSMILAFSPLFLVMQHTLMTDIPTLAFWLASIAGFLWAVHLKSTRLYAASAFFQTAAMLTSYQSFALIPLLGFYQWRRRGGRKGWLSLLIAPAIVGVWFTVNCIHYKRLLFGATVGYMQTRHPLSLHVLGIKLLSILEYQGWLIIFPFFVFYLLARHLKGRGLILVLLSAACLAQLKVPEYRLVDRGIFVLGLAAGFFTVLEMGRIAWDSFRGGWKPLGFDDADGQFIGLWYFGVLLYCLFLFTEGSARYVLPLVPPFLICFFRILENTEISEYRLPVRVLNSAMLASGSLVVSLTWGLALSHADQEFARLYPRIAKEFCRIAGTMQSYCIGEWGFRYYLGRTGVQVLPADESSVRGGSFIAIPKLALPYEIPADLNSMTMPVQTLTYRPGTPLRILDWQTPAGFYSSGWGLIPFSFSQGTLEEIEVVQVNFMVERLPWAQIEADSGTRPWPGHLTLEGKSPLAIFARAGTRILYPWPVQNPIQLRLLCGVSPDSYVEGAGSSYQFQIRQLEADGSIMAESSITLQPGIKRADRNWQPVRVVLGRTMKGALDFRYHCVGGDSKGTGAFAQATLAPAD
jgi:4-amino-4-deoxy-L-arabinose transferase-like glycosyltransferase